MTKAEFLGVFLGFITKKSDEWLPEEAPEDMLLDIMQRRLLEHNKVIRDVLRRTGNGNNMD